MQSHGSIKKHQGFCFPLALVLFFFIAPAGALALTPEQVGERLNTGRSLLFQGRIDEGIRVLEEAAAADRENVNVLYYLGKGYSWKGDWGKGEYYYYKVKSLTGRRDDIHWQAQFGIAQIAGWRKKYDESVAAFELILTEYRRITSHFQVDVCLAIGDVYSWKPDYPKALEYYNRALRVEPSSTEALNRIAKIYQWDHRISDSRKYTRMALEIDKDNLEAKRRLEELELVKDHTISLGNTLVVFDTKNGKGESVKKDITTLIFDWQAWRNVVLHFETSAGYQNYTQKTVSTYSSDWNQDVNAGLGTVVRMFSGTYVNVNANYTFDAEILPAFTAATEVVQKLSRRLDFLVLYRYLYDKNYEFARKESPVTHLFSTGVTFYASDNVYTQVQGYMEDNSKDLVYSFFLHQSFGISPRDRLDGYFSYGKGINHLVFPDKTVSVNVTTIGIAVAYTHFFPSGFGIKPSVGYHDRVDSYTDYTLGLEAIWKF